MSILSRLLGGADERTRKPEAAARLRRGAATEGLAWLGRPPGAKAGAGFRLLWLLGRTLVFRVFGIRPIVEGREHIPSRGGQIVAAAVHRGWVDPVLLIEAFPLQPRLWFIGGANTMFDRRWKERLLWHVGGMLPVWRGGSMEPHVAAARAVVDGGARLALYIEGSVAGPEDSVHKARYGAAFLALRTSAPIIPVAVHGTRSVYRGKRVAARILPPVTVRELVGADWPATDPDPDSREELALVQVATHRLVERIDEALLDIAPSTRDVPGARRRWQWMGRLFG